MYSYVLFLGCAFGIVSELLELTNLGFTATTIFLSGLGNILLAVGLMSFWKIREINVLGQVTSACFACGALIMGLFHLNSFGAGLHDDIDLVSHSFFLTGAMIAVIGIVGLGVWMLTYSSYPKWTGFAMIINPIISISSITILPFLMLIQPFSNIFMTVAIGVVALQNITESSIRMKRENPNKKSVL